MGIRLKILTVNIKAGSSFKYEAHKIRFKYKCRADHKSIFDCNAAFTVIEFEKKKVCYRDT